MGLSSWQQFVLVVFRFAVGWHLFYQGMGKLRAPYWSASGYLRSAGGPFGGLFQAIAADPKWLRLADAAAVWGLMLLGLLLMLGLFTRAAGAGAILLLLSFYAAQPPIPNHGFVVATLDGYELYVNKIIIEALAIATVSLAFNTGRISGLDMLVRHWRLARVSKPLAGAGETS